MPKKAIEKGSRFSAFDDERCDSDFDKKDLPGLKLRDSGQDSDTDRDRDSDDDWPRTQKVQKRSKIMLKQIQPLTRALLALATSAMTSTLINQLSE